MSGLAGAAGGRAGSYDPTRSVSGGLDGELARLEAQAALTFDQEADLLRASGFGQSGTVLEIGAGSGAVTRRLAKSFPGVRLIAFDIDSRLLALAPDDGCTSRVVGDAMRLPFAEHSVEDVLLRYVVQHLADPVAVFRQVREVLRPGGRLAVVDVDDACWGLAEPYYAEMAGVHRKIAEAQSDAGGSRAVGRRLTRWLRSAGFADVRLRLFVTSTDDHPVDDFAPHLGPSRLSTLVAEGVLSLGELALAAERWRRFRCDPDAWVALVGFLAIGTAPITDPAG